MRQVGIPTGVMELPPRAVKMYGCLAANGWPRGLTTHGVAQLVGMEWRTADAALSDLQAAGFIDHFNQPLGGGR